MSTDSYQHTPVLLKEVIEFLNIKPGGLYVDCTLGGGGHAAAMKGVRLFAFDQDEDALAAARTKLFDNNNITYIHDNFANLKKHIQEPVDGVLFDLGVSSYQIDEPARGFSLQHDGPLDMRMDKSQKLTAEKIINSFRQADLEKIFKELGEERFSHRIAKAIITQREKEPIVSTVQLKQVIEKAIPTWKKRESETRIFQALRIYINNELENLKSALAAAIELLKPGGRIVVISYHSLEDRIVKHVFKEQLKVLTKKPVQPTDEETASNPRARSAKLRAGEKQ
ncbi:MAG: 16S rRNA (cytosine(1402)-N(4))-methyltransferase RsmH [Candidatus Margulisbacteria bacterium]|nr:16S rRNA (cytosine(1402)-N(4))-methyltransferase RsmH [Candidatus Margulisiibacteriota bacterium]